MELRGVHSVGHRGNPLYSMSSLRDASVSPRARNGSLARISLARANLLILKAAAPTTLAPW